MQHPDACTCIFERPHQSCICWAFAFRHYKRSIKRYHDNFCFPVPALRSSIAVLSGTLTMSNGGSKWRMYRNSQGEWSLITGFLAMNCSAAHLASWSWPIGVELRNWNYVTKLWTIFPVFPLSLSLLTLTPLLELQTQNNPTFLLRGLRLTNNLFLLMWFPFGMLCLRQ